MSQQHTSKDRKGATEHTKKAQQAVKQQLPFDNTRDFDDARRGLIGQPEDPVIREEGTNDIVVDMARFAQFQSIDHACPDTANPSLWRQGQLNNLYGLYQIHERIYQLRGFDMSVMTIIVGDSGYIVVDPMTFVETARAGLDFFFKQVERKPIVAVLYTHSHVDHFGGVRGIITDEDVKKGTQIIAPKAFMYEAVSENIFAGNAMSRRSAYMYGLPLDAAPDGDIGSGLGKAPAVGTISVMAPTHSIDHTGQTMMIDGVEIIFQYTPHSEAPAEFMFYLPQFKALCTAENATHLLHNVYTVRGAQVRDARKWSAYLDEAIQLFGSEVELVFASHHWSMWGNEAINTYLEKQRDLYKYIHDETLRLANHGYTSIEIAEQVALPPELAQEWHCRGYYGSVSHNVKAVYQKYLGWYDGNPCNLHPLPPEQAGTKYVEYMGGADTILQKAHKDFEAGHYRWVAQVLNHLVFANPDNESARLLLADTLEQLGYQAESGPWRDSYLVGALELREGRVRKDTLGSNSPDVMRAVPIDLLFDYLAIRLNGSKAAGKHIVINWALPDQEKQYVLTVKNGVLNYHADRWSDNADITVTIDREKLDEIMRLGMPLKDAVAQGMMAVEGSKEIIAEFVSLVDTFDKFFNIITP